MVVRPGDKLSPPSHLPYRLVSGMQERLFMADPPPLSHHQIATQTTAHKRPRAALPEIGLHSDGAHGPLHIKSVRLWSGQRVDHNLPCGNRTNDHKHCWIRTTTSLPSMDAVATKSPVASIEISTMDAMWGLYDFRRLPARSRMCTMPPCVPKA